MNDMQFYTLIAIPLLGILLNSVVAISMNSRMSTVEARMLNLENKLEARMLSVESKLEARLLSVESKLEARMVNLENTFTTRFDLLMGRLMDLEREIHKG